MAERLIHEDATVRVYEEETPVGVNTRYEYKAGSPTLNAQALDDRMDQALAGLRTYVNTASPTNAQTVTAVKLLCRVVIALIRRHRDQLDGID